MEISGSDTPFSTCETVQFFKSHRLAKPRKNPNSRDIKKIHTDSKLIRRDPAYKRIPIRWIVQSIGTGKDVYETEREFPRLKEGIVMLKSQSQWLYLLYRWLFGRLPSIRFTCSGCRYFSFDRPFGAISLTADG